MSLITAISGRAWHKFRADASTGSNRSSTGHLCNACRLLVTSGSQIIHEPAFGPTIAIALRVPFDDCIQECFGLGDIIRSRMLEGTVAGRSGSPHNSAGSTSAAATAAGPNGPADATVTIVGRYRSELLSVIDRRPYER